MWTRWKQIFAFALLLTVIAGAVAAGSDHVIYVSNERSGDVTLIDGANGTVTAIIPVGKRPRGIHCSPDGSRVYVALSGSPRRVPAQIVHARRQIAQPTASA